MIVSSQYGLLPVIVPIILFKRIYPFSQFCDSQLEGRELILR